MVIRSRQRDRATKPTTDTLKGNNMTHETALTKALVLCVTAPEHRLGDALKLAHEIADMCTPSEIARAKKQAKEVME